MRKALTLTIALMSLAFVARASVATDPMPNKAWPSTVDEAVDRLLGDMPADDVDWMRRNPKEDVVGHLYMGYGTGVRNEFGLWGDNDALRKSCGTDDPEGCSVVIIEAMWNKVQAQTDPALRAALQCQFATVHRVRIDTKGWYLLRLGEMLDDMQSQIDRQMPAAAAPGCPTQLRIVPAGNPNRQCFVRAEFETEQPLDTALMWLGFRNALTPRHAPPDLEFEFSESCAWPERPTHFAPKR
ncbi:hypothetical protein LYSHEL_26850 [Lysobacter helvus]|uniref:DUF6794 domain-containing protein n=2 Tax=Lysobacteraceae TaxID=32033 RepID=A0ABM7Q876_9GAMM|nr:MULTISPECIES: DUF6794 domain-containing protein [Lysobacter]BCT93658.1 hypothetical protein LYSCAS_26820 [Lysobacter caseinilyticus]BCT96814.1 hypothetical protein LYSHEL_26850 [Lysobacter helvus]